MDDHSKLSGAVEDGKTEPLINADVSPEQAKDLLEKMKGIAETIENVSVLLAWLVATPNFY